MTTRMRAAVLTAPGRIAIDRVPLPEPRAGEVRISIEGCGVCASNLGPWTGLPWLTYPTAPGDLGHEAWGYVDAVGDGVSSFAVGDRVTGLTFRSFADYDVAPADRLLKTPAALADGPVPGEPLGCAINIFRRCDIREGQTVAIIGIGFLGALLTRLVSQAGARVVAISRRKTSLDLARTSGAAEVIAMDDHLAIVDMVRDVTGGRFCERVVEAVGKQWPLDLAGELVAEGGKLIVAGYHQDGPRQVNMQTWNWKGIDVVNAHERNEATILRGIHDAIDAVVQRQLDPVPLYSATYPLECLGDALDATRDKPGAFVKALIDLRA